MQCSTFGTGWSLMRGTTITFSLSSLLYITAQCAVGPMMCVWMKAG